MITLKQSYSYESIAKEMNRLAREYKTWMECLVIGESHDGRAILMSRVGHGDKTLFCTAGVHGREIINPVILVKMIEEYARAYEDGILLDGQYDVRQLLQKYSICFIPLVNPDGYEIALHGFSAIRNPILRQAQRIRRLDWRSWKFNARGVDINRNFPCQSYVRQSYYEYPASENETIALMEAFGRYPSVGYLDFHSRGKVIYYYRKAMGEDYNQSSQRLASHIRDVSRYSLGSEEDEFLTGAGGNTVHYYSENFHAPAITVETVEEDADFPLKSAYQESTYSEVRCIPLEMLAELTGWDTKHTSSPNMLREKQKFGKIAYIV